MSKTKLELKDFIKIPNLISIFRLLISLFIFSAIFFSIDLLTIQILYIIGAISDKADGIIARKFKWETKLGQYLEGIADGLLIFITILYLAFRSDLPQFYILISPIIFIFGFLFIMLGRLITGRWFSVILPDNKIAVFLGHLVILLYIFSIPMRERIVSIIFFGGVILLMIYLIKIVRFILINIKNKNLKNNIDSV